MATIIQTMLQELGYTPAPYRLNGCSFLFMPKDEKDDGIGDLYSPEQLVLIIGLGEEKRKLLEEANKKNEFTFFRNEQIGIGLAPEIRENRRLLTALQQCSVIVECKAMQYLQVIHELPICPCPGCNKVYDRCRGEWVEYRPSLINDFHRDPCVHVIDQHCPQCDIMQLSQVG
jgi:hypothetical protein